MLPTISVNELFLCLISTLVYSNSLRCDLVFDDVSAIVQNRDVRINETSLWDIFQHDFWGTPIQLELSHKSYRPLTVITFRMNYALHELEPAGYHLVNILLHAMVCVLLYRLAARLIFTNPQQDKFALVAGVLFAVHSIHVEAVTGVVGRAEQLAAIFFLLALLAYVEGRMAPFLLYAVCSSLSKEQGITVLGVCLVYEITFNLISPERPPTFCSNQVNTTSSWRSLCRVTLVIVLGLILVTSRVWIMGGRDQLPVFTKYDNPASFADFPTRHLTYNYLLALNAAFLFFPYQLCCDWTMKSISLVNCLSDGRNFATLVLYLVVFLIVVRSLDELRHKRPAKLPLIVSLTVFPFIPASNLVIPVGFVLAERTLYLPSAGFSLLVAYGLQLIYSKSSVLRPLLNPLLLITVFAFMLKTFTRTNDWSNELSLFMSGVKINPENAKLYNNIGHYYEKEKNWSEAMAYFNRAKEVQPDDLGSTINIARTLLNMGESERAEELLWYIKPKVKQSARLNSKRIVPSYLNLWINLGNIIAQNSSRLKEAEEVYLELIAMRSDFVEAYINLGDILIKQNRINDAIQVYEKALHFDQKIGDLNYNLGVAHSLLLEQQSDGTLGIKDSLALSIQIQKIAAFFTKSLETNPSNKEALINLAIMAQKYPAVLRGHKPAVMARMVQYRGQEQERIWFNLALLFSDESDNRTAELYLRKAILKKPDFRSALFNLALILIDEQRLFEAEMYLTQLIHYHPNHTKSLLLLGDIYIEFKELDKAEECYNTVLQQDETNLEAIHNLCVVHLKRNHVNLAQQCFDKVKTMSPLHFQYKISDHRQHIVDGTG